MEGDFPLQNPWSRGREVNALPRTPVSARPPLCGEAHVCIHIHTLLGPQATSLPCLLPLSQNLQKGDTLQRQTQTALGESALFVPKVC